MKAVFPVTKYNSALYEQLATLFSKMGANAGHDLLVVTCPDSIEAAQTFCHAVGRLFRSAEVYTCTVQIDSGNGGRNQMIVETLSHLEKSGNKEPIIWMEHAYPTERDWLDDIQDEWNCMPRDRVYLGCVEKGYAVAKDANGEVIPGKFVERERFMRFGVYPPDFYSRTQKSCALRFVGNQLFEHYIRNEVAPKCHPSKLIRTIWASVNFGCDGGSYHGDQDPRYEAAIRKNEPTRVGSAGVSLLHGCRDGSFGLHLLRKDWSAAGRKRSAHRLAPASGSDEVSTLKARIRELEAQIKEVSRGDSVAGPDTSRASNPDLENVRLTDEDDGTDHDSSVSVDTEIRISPIEERAEKRRAGRPKGSKNKAKAKRKTVRCRAVTA